MQPRASFSGKVTLLNRELVSGMGYTLDLGAILFALCSPKNRFFLCSLKKQWKQVLSVLATEGGQNPGW